MSVSLLCLLLLPMFLLPCFLLSHNRLRTYNLCSLPSAIVLLIIFFTDLFVPSIDLNTKIGEIFYPLWKYTIGGYKEFSIVEKYHLSTSFTYLLFYFITYILCYIPVKIFFIGSNPNIHKKIHFIQRFLNSILFLLSTYGIAVCLIAEIRIMLPFDDGFLSFFFNWLYRIEV